MGMFDSLIVKCPKCGKGVEFQSKAGECLLNDYNLSTVPSEIAIDLNGETETCECGEILTIRTKLNTFIYIE